MVTASETTQKSKQIIQKIERNDYDTLILGRRGQGRTYYLGSVARYITERISGRAVWIVP